MRTSKARPLGLIGGVSWESTTHYYQLLNRKTRDRLGGRHSAPLVLWSFDFAPIASLQEEGDWAQLTSIMIDAAKRVEGAGAEALVICANTMHRMADEVAAAISIPLLHIADATAAAIRAADVERPLLLATRFTMEQQFYRARLADAGVETLIPDAADRAELHRIIFEELVRGDFRESSRQALHSMVEKDRFARGVDGVILGCTEFGMLTTPESYAVPAFDTAEIHCRAAIDFSLGAHG